ncbi:MAG TPA: ArsA family ATPase [Mycobacteriales bacterium]
MRVVLFTGKGGVGKTTVAAATTARAAALGRKALVVSTDPAHSLADALGTELGDEPVEVDGGMHAAQVDTQRAFERSWRAVQRYLLAVLDAGGLDPVDAAELTVLPGAEEVLALLAVRDAARSGRFDLVCVDCAPTAETLRLLRLPELLRWWLDRLLPAERRVARALLTRVRSVPMPDATVFEAVQRLQGELADVRALLTEPGTSSVRLVLTPEAVVVAEARRTLTALSLHGYQVDGVVANRVFPAGGDAWRRRWVTAQQAQLEAVRQSFPGLPLWQAAYAGGEPVGVGALAEFGADVYGSADPAGEVPHVPALSVQRTVDGFALSLALPHATHRDATLSRSGDDLVVGVGADRRLLTLPSALRRCVVEGARLDGAGPDARLVVRFAPDPDLWMRS